MNSKLRLAPHLYNKMLKELMDAVMTYGQTQQIRTHLAKVVDQYVEPDHPHTRPKSDESPYEEGKRMFLEGVLLSDIWHRCSLSNIDKLDEVLKGWEDQKRATEEIGCESCGGNGEVAINHGELGIEHMVCPHCNKK